MSGFEFSETMAGSYHLVDRPQLERAFSFTIVARVPSWLGFMRRREAEIEGEVDAVGLARHRALTGTLGLDVLLTRTIPYRFRFHDDDGRPLRFTGTKHVEPARLVHTMTYLPGEIRTDAGALVGEATVRFDLRGDLYRFLSSFQRR